jgi:hypothetical protein
MTYSELLIFLIAKTAEYAVFLRLINFDINNSVMKKVINL